MKYLKLYENYNKLIATSKTDGDWRFTKFDNEEDFKNILDRFYLNKKWLHKEGDFDIYLWEDTSWDKDENEPFWYYKKALYIDYKNYIIKVKTLENKALYSIRDEKNGMTREQELKLRAWIGTDKNPKYNKFKGEYLGMENDFALMKSPLSGVVYRIDKNGDMIDL
jgi:hypothetical protein